MNITVDLMNELFQFIFEQYKVSKYSEKYSKQQRVVLNDPSQWPDCTLSRPALGSAGPTES